MRPEKVSVIKKVGLAEPGSAFTFLSTHRAPPRLPSPSANLSTAIPRNEGECELHPPSSPTADLKRKSAKNRLSLGVASF